MLTGGSGEATSAQGGVPRREVDADGRLYLSHGHKPC